MKTYDAIKEAIKTYIAGDTQEGDYHHRAVSAELEKQLSNKLKSAEVTMTCHGRENFGNVFTRVHYNADNLLTKVLYRHDLSKDGIEGEPFKQYINNFKFDAQQPWTRLASNDPHKLASIPEQLQCEEPLFLTASRDVNRAVLEVFQASGFKEAYIRKWTAQGKGIGLEVVVIVDNDGEFGVYECSMNYYIMPDTTRLKEELLEIHRRKQAAAQ